MGGTRGGITGSLKVWVEGGGRGKEGIVLYVGSRRAELINIRLARSILASSMEEAYDDVHEDTDELVDDEDKWAVVFDLYPGLLSSLKRIPSAPKTTALNRLTSTSFRA